MNLLNLFEDDNSTPNPNYAEELAYQIFKAAPGLDTTGAADEVLDYAFDLAVHDLGRKRAHSLFAYDKDFDSDLVTAYAHLQRQGVAEADPHKFDSDVDYYAAQNAPAKPRHRGQQSPGVNPDDEAYFREIFRKKREAAAKAAQDKDQGVAESQMSELNIEYEDYKKLSPREFFNMYRITKQQWFEKYKSMLPQQRTVEGQEVDASVVIGKLYDIIDHAEDVIKNADFDSQVQKATIVRDRATKALNMIKSGTDASSAFKYFQSGQQGVAEADKKKDDEPEVRDVALQRAISRAKADFPTAGSGIEALAKDFMRSQDQDSKSFDQLRQAERKQDQMLGQIAKIDQEQEQEIQGLEKQNSTLASRLQQLQNVNGELEKKLAAMSGRSADKKSSAADVAVAPAPAATKTTEPIAPKTKAKSKAKSQSAKSSMKSTAAQLAAPKADPMAAMADRIQHGDSSILEPKQRSLDFEPAGNVLEPIIPQAQQNPKFAAAKANASDVDPRYYADLTSKIAKQAIADPKKAKQAYTVHEEEKEAKYSDKYQDMVARVGQKAREQEKSKPVDIKDLARRLAAIDASRKD